MRRVLVTGAAGFIGSNFIRHWLAKQPHTRVVALDALTYAGNIHSLDDERENANFRFVHGNICDEALVTALLRDEALDTIVHFAAESHVDRSISGPDAFVETNVVGTHSLLKCARRVWLQDQHVLGHRFHHVSTDEVFGSLAPEAPAFHEETPYAPNSPYSASKAASDHLVRAYHHTYGLATTLTNCSNNYGPYQFPEKLIPLMVLNGLRGLPLPVYGDGRNVRDWLHVEDHCRGVELALLKGAPGRTYNLGGNCEITNLDVVRAVCEEIDAAFVAQPSLAAEFPDAPAARGAATHTLLTFVKDRPGHDRRYAVNCDRATRELGYRPEVKFEDGLRSVIRWYVGHRDWWMSVLSGEYREWVRSHYGV